ncbi:TatD family hydrolase, partial [Candidatus Dojkabacteria bacterium]|nr:TatD family hydrolase [Candidatus Dojkabacteria bacterium]
ELFEGQIMLAIKHDLPLTVHSRDSLHECLQLLDKHPKAKVVMHSFTGDYGQLLEIRERGHLVGINGIITYSSAKDLRKGLTKYLKDSDIKTPKDLYSQGIVLETDSPFLLPRGSVQKKNQPANIQLIWNEILFLIK